MKEKMRNLGRVALGLILSIGPAAHGVTRRALVFGNDSYPGHELRNARNDGKAMATVLGKLGYVVSLTLDSDMSTMTAATDQFVRSIAPGDVVLIYYAGHGLQEAGENYLIPTDFKARSADEVPERAYSLSKMLQAVSEGGASTQIVILDACRDNPFIRSRSLSNAGWFASNTAAGAFLAFGTSPGSTAADEPQGNHGLFTKVLLRNLTDSAALDLDSFFEKVREGVIRESRGAQVPWTASSLIGQLHLDPRADLSAAPLDVAPQIGDAESTMNGRSLAGNFVLSSEGATSTLGLEPSGADQAEREAALLARGMHFDKAITLLESAVEISPASAPLRLLGMLLAMVGRHEEAKHALNRAVELDPDDGDAYAYSCFVQVQQSPRALPPDCTKAMSMDEISPNSHLILSAALEAHGSVSPAESEVNKALKAYPSSSVALQLRKYIISKE